MKDYEHEEIERTIEDLGLFSSVPELIMLFQSAPAIMLTSEIWNHLQNADIDVKTPQDVRKKLLELGRDPFIYDRIVREMQEGIWRPPYILHYEDQYYLISGNTRLMVCKVNHIYPKVRIAELTESFYNRKKLRIFL